MKISILRFHLPNSLWFHDYFIYCIPWLISHSFYWKYPYTGVLCFYWNWFLELFLIPTSCLGVNSQLWRLVGNSQMFFHATENWHTVLPQLWNIPYANTHECCALRSWWSAKILPFWIAKFQENSAKWGCRAGPKGAVSSTSAFSFSCLYCHDCPLNTQMERVVQSLLYLFFTTTYIKQLCFFPFLMLLYLEVFALKTTLTPKQGKDEMKQELQTLLALDSDSRDLWLSWSVFHTTVWDC